MLIRFLEKHILRKKTERHLGEALLIDVGAIMIWRGVWGLMDLYLFPERAQLSFVISIIAGLLLLFSIRYVGPRL